MKSKIRQIPLILLVVIFFFISGIKVHGQGKVNLSAGIGYPELLNVGLRYQLNQTQLGLSIGGFPGSTYSGNLLSLSGDFYYHFAGLSKYSDLRIWYGRIGINCSRESLTEIIVSWNSNLRIGRYFYFAKNFGVGMDGGLNYHFNSDITGNPTIAPATGICCFYRF